MDKKILAGAVAAGLLVVPASHAAIDDAGMQYTSAGEGFYGSLRVRLRSVETESGDSTDVNAPASRLGVRGSVDLGGGLSANYRYEFGVNPDNGSNMGSTRLHNVGLSGGFGSVSFGTQWGLDYNYVWATTDVMNWNSGPYAYTDERAGRQSNELAYYSPDFNGFDFGLAVVVDAAADSTGGEAETVDEFKVGARYTFGGFSVAGTYVAGALTYNSVADDDMGTRPDMQTNTADGTMDTQKSDPKSFGVALGYGQDNWSVGYYYGDTDYGATDADGDSGFTGSEKIHALAAQVSIDKATLRAVYETKDNKLEGSRADTDESFWTVGAQYDLGSKSRIYAEVNRSEAANGDETDVWEIGHRVDF